MSLEYSDLDLHNYLNTRPVFAGLDVSDLAKAAVIGNLGMLLAGGKGTGKSQLANDIFEGYFGGAKRDGGQGIMIRCHPEVDIYNEIFTQMDLVGAQRVLTDNVSALFYWADEINRAPPVAQNQFFPLGDGSLDHKGKRTTLGQDGYHVFAATANLGNGRYTGTFQTDEAMYNRMHVALDFDNPKYRPTREDQFKLDERASDPNVKESPKKDISQLLIEASKEVSMMSADPGTEASMVINYLRFGLDNCQQSGGAKKKSWPLSCQGCTHNPNDESLCSLIKAPEGRRTIEATMKYASALQYLAKLKNPKQDVNAIDLVFFAFELTGAYQFSLNPGVLRQKYEEQNPVMMSEVVGKLKNNFKAHQDYIFTSLEAAKKGREVTAFFNVSAEDARRKLGLGKEDWGIYEDLPQAVRDRVAKIEPFHDKGEIGLSWVLELIKCNHKK